MVVGRYFDWRYRVGDCVDQCAVWRVLLPGKTRVRAVPKSVSVATIDWLSIRGVIRIGVNETIWIWRLDWILSTLATRTFPFADEKVVA